MFSAIGSAIANFLAPTANAQFDNSGGNNFDALPLLDKSLSLNGLIDTIISIMLLIAGALAVIYLIYAGILYITAGGEPTKAEKARTGIVNSIIGIIIIVLAFVIEKTIIRLFFVDGGGLF